MKKAIFGVFDTSFSPGFPQTLEKMAVPLERFGDTKQFFVDDSIGLGVKQGRPGGLKSVRHITVVAYARLDNKNELLVDLGVGGEKDPAHDVSTEEIIALAYLKWGRKCPGHLLGDFVFAVWDSHNKWLFCARDHMGMKPFYYSCANKSFAFSSTLESLLALDSLPKDINEERIADYFTSVCLDNTTTFYTHILRLPPARRRPAVEGRRLGAWLRGADYPPWRGWFAAAIRRFPVPRSALSSRSGRKLG
jgi:asparagine synthetase B (glutamine-hydrolysing)